MIALLVAAPQNFIDISQQIFFTNTSIRKCRNQLEINPVWFVLSQFHSKKATSQSPCLGIELNIEGATDHSYLINRSGTKYKAVLLYIILTTLTFFISNEIIFLLDQFQPHLPAVISTIRMLVFII